jgi:hypothetical protein
MDPAGERLDSRTPARGRGKPDARAKAQTTSKVRFATRV